MNEGDYIPISDSDSADSLNDKDEFRMIKQSTENQKQVESDDNNDNSDECPICFEPWTSTGRHKLCCLRCGHLFGFSCILRWIKSQGKEGRCPQCNVRATRPDIRFLYTKRLCAMDTSERDRALSDLTVERATRRKAEQEAAEHKAKYQLLQAEYVQLQQELQTVRAISQSLGRYLVPTGDSEQQNADPAQTALHRRYKLLKTISISNTGNCRVLASCDYLNILCVSQPSTNPIFRGFGVRKVHTVDQRPLKYVHLHSRPIRDIAFHLGTQDGLLASASLDKTVRLTSLLTDHVVQTYQCPSPVWSCCWACPDPNRLFAGCSNGSVLLFDVRVTSGPLATLSVSENESPVIGLQYVSKDEVNSLCPDGGLLVGQLTKITFMKESVVSDVAENRIPTVESDNPAVSTASSGRQSPDLFQTNSNSPSIRSLDLSPGYVQQDLPLEGSLASISLAPNGRQFLASYRPSQKLPKVRHLLAELTCYSGLEEPLASAGQRLITCRELHSLWAGSRMIKLTRAQIYREPEADMSFMVAAGCEEVGGVIIWRCDTGARFQTIYPPGVTADNPVLDLCPFSNSSAGQDCLALLTEKDLHLYGWNSGP